MKLSFTGGVNIVPLTINISEKAASKVKEFSKQSENIGLRVAVKGGGCSGLTYDLDIAATPGPNDKIIEEHGLRLFIDKKSYVFLAGTQLDFTDGLNGKGFVFNNPNAKTTCGCGTSFSV